MYKRFGGYIYKKGFNVLTKQKAYAKLLLQSSQLTYCNFCNFPGAGSAL